LLDVLVIESPDTRLSNCFLDGFASVSGLSGVFICWQFNRRDLVYWPFLKIPSRFKDLTTSLIGIFISSLLTLATRPRRGEKKPTTLRRTSASASASWMPQKSTSRLVL